MNQIYQKYLNYIFIFLIAFFTSSCGLFRPSAKISYEKNKKFVPYDAIIVPGVPYDGKSWSGTMKIRVHWSKYLYDKGYAKNIIYSGSAVYSPYVEAKVMALYGEALGIPKENIFVEDKAEHSTENVYYSYRIAKNEGFKKIAVATDPYQTNNLRYFVRKYEIPVVFLPIVFDTLSRLNRYEPEIDPSGAMAKDFVSLVERENKWQRLKGTLGQNIIWYEEDLKKKRFRRKHRKTMVPSRD